MNRFAAAIFFFLCLFGCTGARAQTQQPDDRIKGWASDIDTMLAMMKREHYVYRTKPLPVQLIKNAIALKSKISSYSDERMLTELERLMFYMHDGHSYILPVSTKFVVQYLPIQFYIFDDGVYVIDADEPYKELIGSKVLTIHGVAVNKIIEGMQSYIHQDNKFTVKWFAPSVLRFRATYEPFGLPPDAEEIELTIHDAHDKNTNYRVKFIPATNFHSIPKLIPSQIDHTQKPPLYLRQVSDNYWFTSLSQNRTLYFQFNQVEDKPGETIASFAERLDSALIAGHPELFIIDVRHNNGGNLDLLPPLMKAISHFENLNRYSKIIVITGRNTFSAAQVFISLINKDTKALFAGEPSSSRPNFVGEGNYITLPWSGALGSISNRYHESIPGDHRKWIAPNFPVTLLSKQYFLNEDPVMDFLLKKFTLSIPADL